MIGLRSVAAILLSIAIFLDPCAAPAAGAERIREETCEREGIKFRLLGLLSGGAALPSSWEADAMMAPEAHCERVGLDHDHAVLKLGIDSDAWSRMGNVLVSDGGSCTEHGLRCLVTAWRIESQGSDERGQSKRQDAAVAVAALAHRKIQASGTDRRSMAMDGLGFLKWAATINGSRDDALFNSAAAFASHGRLSEARVMLSTFLSRRCTPTSCIADYSVQQAIKELWLSGQLTSSNWNEWNQHLAILTSILLADMQHGATFISPWEALMLPLSYEETHIVARLYSSTIPRPSPPLVASKLAVEKGKLVVAVIAPTVSRWSLHGLVASVFAERQGSRVSYTFHVFRDEGGPLIQGATRGVNVHMVDPGGSPWLAINNAKSHVVMDMLGWLPIDRSLPILETVAQRPAPIAVHAHGFYAPIGGIFQHSIADSIVWPPEMTFTADRAPILMPLTFQANAASSCLRDEWLAAHGPEPPNVEARLRLNAQAQDSQSNHVNNVSHATTRNKSPQVSLCAFHEFFKITPEIFGVWMSMLQKLPGAILFFSHKSYSCHARVHLRRAAAQARVDPDRLIFLERADSRGGYLSLVSGCDLLLDTPLFNAQTTAVDFLWANVAILTLPSGRWVGRVGASLARACSTPTSVIVARDESDYRRLGIAMASRAALLARKASKDMSSSRHRSPVFDTPRWSKAFEASLASAWDTLSSQDAHWPIVVANNLQ